MDGLNQNTVYPSQFIPITLSTFFVARELCMCWTLQNFDNYQINIPHIYLFDIDIRTVELFSRQSIFIMSIAIYCSIGTVDRETILEIYWIHSPHRLILRICLYPVVLYYSFVGFLYSFNVCSLRTQFCTHQCPKSHSKWITTKSLNWSDFQYTFAVRQKIYGWDQLKKKQTIQWPLIYRYMVVFQKMSTGLFFLFFRIYR